eukprot:UN07310
MKAYQVDDDKSFYVNNFHCLISPIAKNLSSNFNILHVQ